MWTVDYVRINLTFMQQVGSREEHDGGVTTSTAHEVRTFWLCHHEREQLY